MDWVAASVLLSKEGTGMTALPMEEKTPKHEPSTSETAVVDAIAVHCIGTAGTVSRAVACRNLPHRTRS